MGPPAVVFVLVVHLAGAVVNVPWPTSAACEMERSWYMEHGYAAERKAQPIPSGRYQQ